MRESLYMHVRRQNQINDNSWYLFQVEEKRVAAHSDHQRDESEQGEVHFLDALQSAT